MVRIKKCKNCANIFKLSDGRLLCTKKPILKSLVQPDRMSCDKYRRNNLKEVTNNENN